MLCFANRLSIILKIRVISEFINFEGLEILCNSRLFTSIGPTSPVRALVLAFSINLLYSLFCFVVEAINTDANI